MALRLVWKPPRCECPAAHKTAGRWKGNREREREKENISERTEEKRGERKKTWGFYVKEGIFVKCILCNEPPQFCYLKQCYLELENKNLSFSCSPWIRLFPAYTGPTSISRKHCFSVLSQIWSSGEGVISELLLGDCSFFQDISDTER